LERNDTLRAWGGRYARIVLERCRGNKREAARLLGISYHTLNAYLRQPTLTRSTADTFEAAAAGGVDTARSRGPGLVCEKENEK
jgi:hypothetical protein